MISARIATMLRAVGCALALVVTTLITEVTAHGDTPAFAKFKNEMMPKVGQKITVVGNLHDGKDGFWLAFNNWGVYIRSVKESGLSRENDLYVRFPPKDQTVKVIGVLRIFHSQLERATTSMGERCKPRLSTFSSMLQQ